jgi:hypothetical protein
MNLIPTDVLLKTLAMRSDKFAIAYKLPSDEEMSVIMLHGSDYYSSLGLATGLLEDMKTAPLREDGVWLNGEDDEPED